MFMKKLPTLSILSLVVVLFTGCTAQPVDQQAPVAPTPAVTAPAVSPNGVTNITTKDESAAAKKTLIDFFDAMSKNDFAKAVTFTDENNSDFWDQVSIYGQGTTDKAKMLQNNCSGTGTCVPADVLEVKQVTNDEYHLVVHFTNTDGSKFVYGPFGGAGQADQPPQTKFDFTVRKINNVFKVMTPPLYRP